MKRRYRVLCRECGEIEADTEDGLYDRPTAERRAGFHEGAKVHKCTVEVAEETPEFECPICHTTVTGEQARDEHAAGEPGMQPSAMRLV